MSTTFHGGRRRLGQADHNSAAHLDGPCRAPAAGVRLSGMTKSCSPLPQQQQQQPPQPQQQQSHQFGSQIQHQHRAVARGPKLHFPEFTGEDCDGWIRKAEKYFELVGIPNEDRVRIAVLYVSGKAEYWWRGTGCNANTLPWHHFCRMVGDRFNQVSE